MVETTAGIVTNTKQFVWCGSKRSEEREGSAINKFFDYGELHSSTQYFYSKDHLGSTREMTDNSGVIQAQYAFDPFGQVTKSFENVSADFGYTAYYLHSRNGLNLTLSRAYSATFGRWINRDRIEENGGTNMYAYVVNDPIVMRDPSGLAPLTQADVPNGVDLSGAWLPIGYPQAGLDYITSKHGPDSPVNCCKPRGDGKWTKEAWAANTSLINAAILTATNVVYDPKTGLTTYFATFDPVTVAPMCPTCDPNAPIGKYYAHCPIGPPAPPVPVWSLNVVLNQNHVIITAYPMQP